MSVPAPIRQRLIQAETYARAHLLEALTVPQLAEVAALSAFHFNRLFAAQFGAPAMTHLRRLRLEWAAAQLTRGRTVSELAAELGYAEPESLTRAFRAQFGVSPSDYRAERQREVASAEPAPIRLDDLRPERVVLPLRQLLYTIHTGPYAEMGPRWRELIGFAYRRGILKFWQRPDLIGICYDDPEVTDVTLRRYDCCVVMRAPLRDPGPYLVQTHTGGAYLRITHLGPYDGLSATYQRLFRWLVQESVELRPQPVLEQYRNHPDRTEPSRLRTDIFVPIV